MTTMHRLPKYAARSAQLLSFALATQPSENLRHILASLYEEQYIELKLVQLLIEDILAVRADKGVVI